MVDEGRAKLAAMTGKAEQSRDIADGRTPASRPASAKEQSPAELRVKKANDNAALWNPKHEGHEAARKEPCGRRRWRSIGRRSG